MYGKILYMGQLTTIRTGIIKQLVFTLFYIIFRNCAGKKEAV
jgi:hypothetical protein